MIENEFCPQNSFITLKYFSAPNGNFGDELNPYIFKTLFPDLLKESTEKNTIDFYGIGTLIDSRIDQNKQTILFGTGVNDISMTYKKDNWDIFFCEVQ